MFSNPIKVIADIFSTSIPTSLDVGGRQYRSLEQAAYEHVRTGAIRVPNWPWLQSDLSQIEYAIRSKPSSYWLQLVKGAK